MDQIADGIIATLGMDQATLMGVLALVSLVCRLIGKSIPDDKVGLPGLIRKVCKALGLYVGNKIESGVSTNDVAKTLTNRVK